MTKKFFYVASMILCAMFVFNACSDSNDNPSSPTPNPPSGTGISQGTTVKPANMKMSGLSGFVYDTEGNALSGVTVTSGDETFTTGSDGGFKLDKVNSKSGRTIVKFTCGGYVDVVRSFTTQDGAVWEVVMVSTYAQGKTANKGMYVNQGTSLETTAGMKVDLQSDGLKYKDPDKTVGQWDYASVNMLYLSPDDETFAQAMPGGDLAAVRTDGSEAQLISYGMTKVDMKISGYDAQLADGKPATLTFPVPEKFKDNTPDQIPLWSFNEETGLWEEEGIATYDANNNVYVGTVTHFSWVNLDYPESRATVKVVVKDQAGTLLPNVKVDIDGQRSCFTDINGVAECFVPTNTAFYVTVHSEDYSNYSPEVKENVTEIAQVGATKTVDIVLPTLAHISGKVVNAGKGNALATLWIEYNGKETKRVHNDAQGQFILNAPADYKGAAKLMLRASEGSVESYDITLDGEDHAYTLTIATDQQTGGSFTFTVQGGKTYSGTVAPVYFEDLDGVEICDDHLSVSSSSCYADIYGYSDRQSTYTNQYFSVYDDFSVSCDSTATIQISVNEYKNYRFKVSGAANYNKWQSGQEERLEGTLSADFTVPLLGKGQTLQNVTKKESYLPSFMPWMQGKTAIVGMRILESPKFGAGAALWYVGDDFTYNDYLDCKAQATRALGEPVECFDAGDAPQGDVQNQCSCIFAKDGKYVSVSYNPWANGDEEWIKEEMQHMMSFRMFIYENHFARMAVLALDGMKLNPQDMLYGRVKEFKGKDWRPAWAKRK